MVLRGRSFRPLVGWQAAGSCTDTAVRPGRTLDYLSTKLRDVSLAPVMQLIAMRGRRTGPSQPSLIFAMVSCDSNHLGRAAPVVKHNVHVSHL